MKGAYYMLNLELSALQENSKGEVLANPRALTLDRCKELKYPTELITTMKELKYNLLMRH